MRLMMVITGLRSGGAERVMITLCNQLIKKSKIRLLVLKDKASDYTLSDEVELVAGNIINQSILRSVCFIRCQMNEWKPDLVLSFMTKTNIVVLLAKLITTWKAPIVIAERANPKSSKMILHILKKILYPKADGCVFQTKQAQEFYKGILKCKSEVICNPLNPDFNIHTYKGVRKKKIVSMGRLSFEKNQKLLIEAFSKITDRHPEYLLEIYGDGPLRNELHNQIKELNLDNKIFLMGRKNNIQKYIYDAEIFVLPSNSEGMPNALLEAMALGLACISTDCPIGGPAVIIDNEKNGLLVPMNDINMMAHSIERLIVDTELARKVRVQAVKVVDDYEVESVCDRWEDYLKEVAKSSKNL